jgi:hypothetical protein
MTNLTKMNLWIGQHAALVFERKASTIGNNATSLNFIEIRARA